MEYNEKDVQVEEETTEETSPATPTEEETEADALIELYEGETEESDGSEGISTGIVMAGLGGIALAGAGYAGWKFWKKQKAKKKQPESVPGKELGPKPIPDSVPNAKAIRSRKITMRERLCGHIYLDPAEVERMHELVAQEEKMEDEES